MGSDKSKETEEEEELQKLWGHNLAIHKGLSIICQIESPFNTIFMSNLFVMHLNLSVLNFEHLG